MGNEDLKALQDLMRVSVDELIESKGLVTKEDVSHFPTKDEFYGKMDEAMGELKNNREEQTLLSHKVSNHEDRVEKIESHLGMASD